MFTETVASITIHHYPLLEVALLKCETCRYVETLSTRLHPEEVLAHATEHQHRQRRRWYVDSNGITQPVQTEWRRKRQAAASHLSATYHFIRHELARDRRTANAEKKKQEQERRAWDAYHAQQKEEEASGNTG